MDLDTRRPETEILSQDEIERLLVQVADEASEATIHRTDGTREKRPQKSLQAHDFRTPSFLTSNQWRKLRQEHELFVESLSSRLSNYLRLDVTLRLSRLETATFRNFVQSFAEPTHFALFKTEPLRGISLLEMPPHLGLTIVDRLLGGPGQASSVGRELSEIERALLDQALLMILGEWAQRWTPIQELRPVILGHETSGRYLQSSAPDSMFLVLVLEARLANCVEEFSLAFPCSTLEPLIRQLSPPLEPAAASDKAPASKPKPKWNADFNTIAVPVSAEWPARPISARQLTQLKVGDVLEWDPAAATQIRVRLDQTTKFVGRLGTKSGRWAVEITGSLPANSPKP